MYKLYILLLIIMPGVAHAQAFNNDGGTVIITTGATVTVVGNLTNASGSNLQNNGVLAVSGVLTNNQTMTNAYAGDLVLNGTTAQSIGGTAPYFAKNVLLNNAAGVTLNTALKLDGMFSFQSGILHAPATDKSLVFSANASISGTATPTDASHVNGYVTREGTGNFEYPVGNGTKYQKTATMLTANATGFRVKYTAADAGAGPFTASGTETVPLSSYNNKEFWDMTPLSTATGTVTIFWDGYNDAYGNPVSQRRVAHKMGGNWLNEGNAATATGTTTAGSVTSNPISTFSPFALGSVVAVLPLQWLTVSGNLNAQKNAVIKWKVAEQGVANYEIERSVDGRIFTPLGTTPSVGNGINEYSFVDNYVLLGSALYRVKQADINGRNTYSAVVRLTAGGKDVLSLYPNPANDIIKLTVPQSLVQTKATLVDLNGKMLQQVKIASTVHHINVSNLAAGSYIIKLADGRQVQFNKF